MYVHDNEVVCGCVCIIMCACVCVYVYVSTGCLEAS